MEYQKPPYQITSIILKLIHEISQSIGEVNTLNLYKPATKLRRQNRIRSIYSSLAIEGNSLSFDQVTSIIDNRRVLGPINDIIEVQNAIKVYDLLPTFKPHKKADLLKAHSILMKGLIDSAGVFRKGAVGIVKGSKIEHIAPPAHLVPDQISNLLKYANDKSELALIKSCVFHYEFEFIHPFLDGNGRLGRFWQTLILIQEHPVFEYIPIEYMIKDKQKEYYKALAESDKRGESTVFIEYMLGRIIEGLSELLNLTNVQSNLKSRMGKAQDEFVNIKFSRLDYMKLHKTISSATASRDLKEAVSQDRLEKFGNKNTTRYMFRKD